MKIKLGSLVATISIVVFTIAIVDAYFNSSSLFFGLYRSLQSDIRDIYGYEIRYGDDLMVMESEGDWVFSVTEDPTDRHRGLVVQLRDKDNDALAIGLKKKCRVLDSCKTIETESYSYFKYKEWTGDYLYDNHVACLLKNENILFHGVGKEEDIAAFDKVILQICSQ